MSKAPFPNAEKPTANENALQYAREFARFHRAVWDEFIEFARIHQERNDEFSRKLLMRGIFVVLEGELASIMEKMLEIMNLYFRSIEDGSEELAQAMQEELRVEITIKDYFALSRLSYEDIKNGKERPRTWPAPQKLIQAL